MKKVEKSTTIRGLDEDYTPAMYGQTRSLVSNKKLDLKILYDIVKKNPEVSAAIQAIVEDIMADDWKFTSKFKKDLEKVEEFEKRAKFYKVLSNAIYDLVTTGNAYILKLAISEEKIQTLLNAVTISLAKSLSVKFKEKMSVLVQDEKAPKDLQLLKSSTVTINSDETGKIINYVQEVNGQTRIFKKKDVIHLSLVNIGGEAYGFSPLEPLLEDIGTLMFAKNFAGKYFENDGLPHFIFVLPQENPQSRTYQLVKKEMKEMKKSADKYKNMLLTGEIKVEQVQKFNKDMEFAKLIEHFTQIVLIGLGVPAYRINYTITSKSVGGEVNRAFEGYYKRIAWLQKVIETELNADLFSEFGVSLRFNRAYKIDEMREAQIAQLLSQIGAVSIEEIRERIGMERELPKGETMPVKVGDQNEFDFDEDKRRTQGRENNPEKPDKEMDNRLKSASIKDAVNLEFNNFVRVVERVVGDGNFNVAKLLYRETRWEITIYFTDGNWTYKTIVTKRGLDVDKFKTERLTFAVKLKDDE